MYNEGDVLICIKEYGKEFIPNIIPKKTIRYSIGNKYKIDKIFLTTNGRRFYIKSSSSYGHSFSPYSIRKYFITISEHRKNIIGSL